MFINLGKIGDLTISSVILNNLHVFPPPPKIIFLIRKEYEDLYNAFDKEVTLILWDQKKYKWNPIYRISFLYRLKKCNLSATVDLNNFRPITFDEIALLSGASSITCLNSVTSTNNKMKADYFQRQYDTVVCPSPVSQFEKHLLLLKRYNVGGGPINESPLIRVRKEIANAVIRKIFCAIPEYQCKTLISIAPFASSPTKNWDIEKFSRLITLILSQYDVILLLHGTADKYDSMLPLVHIAPQKIFNLSGCCSIIETAAIIKESALFIGVDSGLTHVSNALRVPTIGIIGCGSLGNFFPYGAKDTIRYIYHYMVCWGCDWKCTQEKPYCLTEVTAEAVYESVKTFLG